MAGGIEINGLHHIKRVKIEMIVTENPEVLSAKNAKDAKSAKPLSCVFVLFALFAFFADHKNICVYLCSSVDKYSLYSQGGIGINSVPRGFRS